MKKLKHHGLLLRISCCAVLLLSGCVEQRENTGPKRDWLEETWNQRHTWPDRIWEDSKDTFTQQNNIMLLSLAGGASIAMHNTKADKSLQRKFETNRVFEGFSSESLNVLGCPGTHFAAAGLWYALSVDSNDVMNENRAWTMMTALAINGLVTVGLKAARNNRNPNGDRWAWPSGHTSSSFTVAAVLDEFYGPKIGIPAYVLASMVGYRMIEEGDHWASDVVFGAALGWVVGHAVAGKHKQLELAGFNVLPLTSTTDGEPVSGLCLVKQF
ncbi:MAG: phosphatase PAP2 family protein [Phycisphaerae bacterium]